MDFKTITIGKHEQNDPAFRAINPLGKVPVIIDGDFVVYESHAILRYLAQKFGADSFYPKDDLVLRTKIDMYMDFHHLGLRAQCHPYFWANFIGVAVPNVAVAEQCGKDIPASLDRVDSIFLEKGNRKYLVGDHLTIADLTAYCEISQLKLLKYDFSPYKGIQQWMAMMESQKGYAETYKEFLNVLGSL
eukprot:gene2445-2781_t